MLLRRHVALGLLAALAPLPVVALSGATAPALASTGTPTPAAPVLLFHEDFENGLAATTVATAGPPPSGSTVSQYVAASGQTYSSDPYWQNTAECNGVVMSQQSLPNVPASGCDGPQGVLAQMAELLGVRNGAADPTANHAVTAFTATTDSPANGIELDTPGPLPIPVTDRFLVFGANVASVGCSGAHPLLRFYLVDGTTEIPTNDQPADPCTAAGAVTTNVNGTDYTVATARSDRAVLYTGATLKLRMRNEQTSFYGDDHAFDDMQIWDATPKLDQAFASPSGTVGSPVDLVFTITNTTDLAAKAGWTFNEQLPAGMVVAGASSSTCATAPSVSAATGGTSIAVTSGTLAAQESWCTITVPAKATRVGTFDDTAGGVSTVGLDAPATTSYRATAAQRSAPTLTTRTAPLVGLTVHRDGTTGAASVRDLVSLAGFTPGGDARGTAELYGPTTSRSATMCTPGRLVARVHFTPRNGDHYAPAVAVRRPGHYTWLVRTSADSLNLAAANGCGLRAESFIAHRPHYRSPVLDTGFDGQLGRLAARSTTASGVIRVPALGIVAPVLTEHLVDGRMTIPSDVGRTGWLRNSAASGERIGSVVIAGHVSNRQDSPGALFRLQRAHVGERVIVRSPTGRRVTYRITSVTSQPRTRGLPQRLFETSGRPQLVLLTCTGRVTYRNGHFHYTRNLVVTARPL